MTDTPRLSRRLLLTGGAAAALLAVTGTRVSAASPMHKMQVWKDPSCGCCKDWIALLQKDGFAVETIDTGNTAVRARLKLPAKYGSCHTGLIDGYVVEGHVPLKDIRRLLKEKPADAIGIAVPGMPIGSPGMDGPEYKGRRDPYDVLLVTKDGGARIWSSYR